VSIRFRTEGYTDVVDDSGLADGFNLSYSHTPDGTWATYWPHTPILWGLLANAPAYTEVHADANGQNTHVRVIQGEKFWYVATNANPKALGDGFDESTLRFQLVVLSPQDDL
jgi:hypothetical protein